MHSVMGNMLMHIAWRVYDPSKQLSTHSSLANRNVLRLSMTNKPANKMLYVTASDVTFHERSENLDTAGDDLSLPVPNSPGLHRGS